MKRQTLHYLWQALLAIMLFGIIFSSYKEDNTLVAHAQVASSPDGAGESQTKAASEVTINLSTDQASFGTAESVILHVAITNPNRTAIQLLKWLAPAEDVEGSLFVITRDGAPVPYLG